jgi:hypothetical protein
MDNKCLHKNIQGIVSCHLMAQLPQVKIKAPLEDLKRKSPHGGNVSLTLISDSIILISDDFALLGIYINESQIKYSLNPLEGLWMDPGWALEAGSKRFYFL